MQGEGSPGRRQHMCPRGSECHFQAVCLLAPVQPGGPAARLVLLGLALLGAVQHLGGHVVQRAGARHRPLLCPVDAQPKVRHLMEQGGKRFVRKARQKKS